ncbi:hypothetical protein EJ05DRAFT_472924, partial [Pseudovirgaria hyperparasitica]
MSENEGTQSNTSRSGSPPLRKSDEDSLIHPVNLLSLHLAQIAKPSCLWMMLTFSEDRIPFRPSPFRKPVHMPEPLPNPIRYWTPVLKQPVVTTESRAQVGEQNHGTMVYRPEVYHYIIVLKRTLEASTRMREVI